MLGKLIKYEFKNTAKVMLILYAFIVAISIVGSIVLRRYWFPTNDSDIADIATVSVLVLYILAIFALFVITYVYMCIHFYKTMYSDQGYLTHTLPVRPLTTLHVKLFVSMIWMLLSFVLLFLSVIGLLTGMSNGEIWQEITSESWQEIAAIYGMIVALFLSCMSYLLWIYASLSIGQLFDQHKIGASVIAGVVIYIINQIIGSATLVLTGYSSSMLTNTVFMSEELYADAMNTVLYSSLLESLIGVIILYVVCNVIVRKHINLD